MHSSRATKLRRDSFPLKLQSGAWCWKRLWMHITPPRGLLSLIFSAIADVLISLLLLARGLGGRGIRGLAVSCFCVAVWMFQPRMDRTPGWFSGFFQLERAGDDMRSKCYRWGGSEQRPLGGEEETITRGTLKEPRFNESYICLDV